MEDISLSLLTLWRLPASHWLGFCTVRTDLSILTHLHQALNLNSKGPTPEFIAIMRLMLVCPTLSSVPSFWYKTAGYPTCSVAHHPNMFFASPRSLILKDQSGLVSLHALRSCTHNGLREPTFDWLGGYTNFRSCQRPMNARSSGVYYATVRGDQESLDVHCIEVVFTSGGITASMRHADASLDNKTTVTLSIDYYAT